VEINEALEIDNTTGSEVLLKLEAIAEQLQKFRACHSHTFSYLCALCDRHREMSLGDAILALNWATLHVTESE